MKKHLKKIIMFVILITVIVGVIIFQSALSGGVCPFCGERL